MTTTSIMVLTHRPAGQPTRQARVFASLIRDTQAAIRQCGYARVFLAVACEVFPDVIDQRPPGGVPSAGAWTSERACARLCHGLLYDYLDAIDEFGYEAVYFGVGCVAFPEAVDPWEGNDY